MSGAGHNPHDREPDALRANAQQPCVRLLIATGAGFDQIVSAATKIHSDAELEWPLLVLFGAAETFPFRPRPSTILVPGIPAGVIACIPQLDEFGVASRLASTAGLPGCYDGPVTELAEIWISCLEPQAKAQLHISVAGANETIASVAALGHRLGLPVGVISG